jgi:DtxR family Mn-dependent transcriptional regulator
MERFQEEILEAIWSAAEDKKNALDDIKNACADRKVAREQFKALEDMKLIRLDDKKIMFTSRGSEMARQIIRRHRLAECLMGYVLKLNPETMERIACETEHTLLPEVEESICTLLGHPDTAPDARPIPPGKCCSRRSRKVPKTMVSIAELEPGENGRIAYIRPKSHERLHRLTSFGLVPGLYVKLHQKTPAFCIHYESTDLAIDRDIAEDIFVWKS